MLSMVDYSAPEILDASGKPVEHNEHVCAPADCDEDALSPARGIVLGVILGAAMWCGIGFAIWLLL
jgi:hypothetical protein